LGAGRLDGQSQVPGEDQGQRAAQVRFRPQSHLEVIGQKDEGRRENQRGALFHYLRAESSDRAWRAVPRVLLLGLVLDHQGSFIVRDARYRQGHAGQFHDDCR